MTFDDIEHLLQWPEFSTSQDSSRLGRGAQTPSLFSGTRAARLQLASEALAPT